MDNFFVFRHNVLEYGHKGQKKRSAGSGGVVGRQFASGLGIPEICIKGV